MNRAGTLFLVGDVLSRKKILQPLELRKAGGRLNRGSSTFDIAK